MRIEHQDSVAVIDFFDQIGAIELEEAHRLISNVYDHYVAQLGEEILMSEDYLKSLDYCKELYHSILEQHGYPIENNLIHDKNQGPYEVLLCGKKKNKKKGAEAEVPGSVILGGVEMLGGALIWVLPFPGTKQLGGIMIADGVRRTFNGLEDVDAKNKKEKNLPSPSKANAPACSPALMGSATI